MTLTKQKRRLRIRNRIRKTIVGDQNFPRLSVFRSNKEIYAQIINDVNKKTIVSASSKDKELKIQSNNKIEISKIVGNSIGKKVDLLDHQLKLIQKKSFSANKVYDLNKKYDLSDNPN